MCYSVVLDRLGMISHSQIGFCHTFGEAPKLQVGFTGAVERRSMEDQIAEGYRLLSMTGIN